MLVIIFVVVTFFMNFTGEVEMSFTERLDLFMANSGWGKIAMLIALAAAYPQFGFIKRDVEGDIVENRDQIIVAMEASGFTFKQERDGKLIFRANTILRRVAFLFEDAIVAQQHGSSIRIEGVRRGVVYVVYCLDGFIKNSKRAQ